MGITFTLYRQNGQYIQSKEGFSNQNSVEYNSCISKGFSKEFCVETPTLRYGPNACQCDDGSTGYYAPGFRGECVCGGSSFYFG